MRVPFVVLGVLLLCYGEQTSALDLTPKNLLNSAKNIATGVASQATNYLPTPQGLFESGKQLVGGYPFEFASSAINKICSAALNAESIIPRFNPDIQNMSFQLMTPCKNYSFPILRADEMWKSPAFDPKKKTILFASGWTNNINESDSIYEVSKAYFCRGDVNFVAVDAASYVDTLYTWSAFNTEDIGESIGKGLVLLTEIVPLENIHLIGHSLGSHIVGAAGRTFNHLTGKRIPRITGLDPAKPCFNEGETLTGLQRGDADFVDIIHSDPGVLGKRPPLGDVDFYPGGLDPLPVGCLTVVCAHVRAWQYYAETVYPCSENNFMATRCNSLNNLNLGKCPGKQYPMGYNVPTDLKGNYFLEVNGESPYGKNSTKKREDLQQCGTCVDGKNVSLDAKARSC